MEYIEVEKTGIQPVVVEEIRDFAGRYDVDQVILFGSRARGDYSRTSDIDLAVSGGDVTRFSLDVGEDTSTLLMFDVIDLSRPVSEELMKAISREGKVLYEKV